jgi:hypothetical protein
MARKVPGKSSLCSETSKTRTKSKWRLRGKASSVKRSSGSIVAPCGYAGPTVANNVLELAGGGWTIETDDDG